jgi:hypothetical protein
MTVLDRRATEAGLDSTTELSDLLPLMFSDSTYKNYPASLLERVRVGEAPLTVAGLK